ncbi:MAG: protein phosphatase [Oscillospiraceae bacterium]|jgi:hypothetical protein|nr:protein phosphatase [Oscillospiraceae bacterium]
MDITDGELVERLARETERLRILAILRECETLPEAIDKIKAISEK